jgi:hypothetical protein
LWLKQGDSVFITFVDGNLIPAGPEAGLLDLSGFYEHLVKGDNRYTEYTCLEGVDICPLCETGVPKSFAAAFTVIDHREWVDSGGTPHKNDMLLYVVKGDSLKKLQALATANGGLAGLTVIVRRAGSRYSCDYEAVRRTEIAELQKILAYKDANGVTRTRFVPLDYMAELAPMASSDLRSLGFGKKGIGAEATTSPFDFDFSSMSIPSNSGHPATMPLGQHNPPPALNQADSFFGVPSAPKKSNPAMAPGFGHSPSPAGYHPSSGITTPFYGGMGEDHGGSDVTFDFIFNKNL